MRTTAAAILLLIFIPSAARAWDENGHVIVTRLAHAKLPESMPQWVRTAEVAARLAYLSAEPDRWRGQHSIDLDHINNPDHYLDIEDLAQYGLSLKTLPKLRREFTDFLAIARVKTPGLPLGDPDKDKAYVNLVPGLLPWTIAELHWKVASSWTTLQTYEKYPDRVTPVEVQTARDNIVFHMGILSHFVGDGAQPLHLTQHHHGWVGDNPKGYTSERGFHAYIDGTVLELHDITPQSLKSRARMPFTVAPAALWSEITDYLGDTFEQVEPLYALEKSGDLKGQKGKDFIEDRLLVGGSMLAGLWISAHRAAGLDSYRIGVLTSRPATQPAP